MSLKLKPEVPKKGALPEVPNSLGLHGRDRFDL